MKTGPKEFITYISRIENVYRIEGKKKFSAVGGHLVRARVEVYTRGPTECKALEDAPLVSTQRSPKSQPDYKVDMQGPVFVNIDSE